MDLLFETAGELQSVASSSCSSSSLSSPSPSTSTSTSSFTDLVTVVSDTIVHIAAQTTKIVNTINTSSLAANVITAIPLPDEAILAALSDSSLLYIPRNTSSTTNLKPIKWPIQPISLQLLHVSVLVICERNLICEVLLSDIARVPDPPSIKYDKTSDLIAACVIGTNLSTLFAFANIMKKRSASSSSSSSSSSLTVSIWKRSSLPSTAGCTWFSAQNSTKSNTFTIRDDQDILSVTSDGISKCVVMVLVGNEALAATSDTIARSKRGTKMIPPSAVSASSASSALSAVKTRHQWKKLSENGQTIFTREVVNRPLNAQTCRNVLFLMSSSVLDLWDISYGVITFSMDITLPPSRTLSMSTPFISHGLAVAPSSVGGSGSYNIYTGNTSPSSKITSIHCLLVRNTNENSAGTLLQAFGGLSKSHTDNKITAEDGNNCDDADHEQSEDGPFKILGGLSSKVKRDLSKAQKKLESEDRNIEKDNDDQTSTYKRLDNKRSGVDVAIECRLKFLVRLQRALELNHEAMSTQDSSESKSKKKAAEHVQFLASDWDALRMIVRTGTVAISRYPLLIPALVSMGRADVLQTIALHCSDLSEVNAVKLLNLASVIPIDALGMLKIQEETGAILWGKGRNDDGENEGTKSNKKRKASSPAANGDEISHLSLLRAMMQSILNRSDGYSTILLSEAVRNQMSVSSASLLLRILALMLKGVCSSDCDFENANITIDDHVTTTTTTTGARSFTSRAFVSFQDSQIMKAVTWAEAIIDGHFSSFALALAIPFHPPNVSTTTHKRSLSKNTTGQDSGLHDARLSTRISIIKAIEIVANVDMAKDEVESLMGSWEQILAMNQNANRTDKKGRPIDIAPVGLYTREVLYL